MSDSKWVKHISVLVDNSSAIKECKVRPIWNDTEPYWQRLFSEHTRYGFDVYDTEMEAMVSGKPTGWYSYKEIEWLDFPSKMMDARVILSEQQNLQFIKGLVDNSGQCKVELTPNKLRLYACFK